MSVFDDKMIMINIRLYKDIPPFRLISISKSTSKIYHSDKRIDTGEIRNLSTSFLCRYDNDMKSIVDPKDYSKFELLYKKHRRLNGVILDSKRVNSYYKVYFDPEQDDITLRKFAIDNFQKHGLEYPPKKELPNTYSAYQQKNYTDDYYSAYEEESITERMLDDEFRYLERVRNDEEW